MIADVLSARQAAEIQEMRSEHDREAALALKREEQKLEEELLASIEQLQQDHVHEMQQTIQESENLSAQDFADVQEAVSRTQQQAVADLEAEAEQKLHLLPSRIQVKYEVLLKEKLIKLKEKHYQEYIETLRDLHPDGLSSEEAHQRAAELDAYRAELEEQQREEEEKLAADEKEFALQQERIVQETLAEYEAELAAQAAQEEERFKKECEDLQNEMLELKEQQRDERMKELKTRAQESVDDPSKLLEQHKGTQNRLNQVMEASKAVQIDALKNKLKERRQKKQRSQEVLALGARPVTRGLSRAASRRASVERQAPAAQKAPSSSLLALPSISDHSSRASSAVSAASSDAASEKDDLNAIPEMQEKLQVEPPTQANIVIDDDDAVSRSGDSDASDESEDFDVSPEMLRSEVERSPLMSRLHDIESFLRTRSKEISGQHPYDRQLAPTGATPILVDDKILSKSQIFCLSFVNYVAKAVCTRFKHAPIEVIFASSLPVASRIRSSAFANSVRFDEANSKILVRVEWSRSLGELLSVVIHALAHFLSNEMAADSSPPFVEKYNELIAMLTTELLLTPRMFSRMEEQVNVDTTLEERMAMIEVEMSSTDAVHAHF